MKKKPPLKKGGFGVRRSIKFQFAAQFTKFVILSERSESKDLRTENLQCSNDNA